MSKRKEKDTVKQVAVEVVEGITAGYVAAYSKSPYDFTRTMMGSPVTRVVANVTMQTERSALEKRAKKIMDKAEEIEKNTAEKEAENYEF